MACRCWPAATGGTGDIARLIRARGADVTLCDINEDMVRAGLDRSFDKGELTPYQALVAATRTPAAYLGRGALTGTIAVGKQADLVLLDANPLENISNARRIQGTMLRGQWLDRARLDALEQQVKDAVRAL